jgi:hypothetical protein
MEKIGWFATHWSAILGDIGIIAGLLFSGLGFWRDVRVRRAETLLEITKQHRELWNYYGEHPELHGLFDPKRVMERQPLTTGELRFANSLFLHLCANYGARQAGIHVMPDHVADDWREIFGHLAMAEAWLRMRHLHDRKFAKVVEEFRASAPAKSSEYQASLKQGLSAVFEQLFRRGRKKPSEANGQRTHQ